MALTPVEVKEVYSGFVGMYNFKGNLGSGHSSIVRLAQVSGMSPSAGGASGVACVVGVGDSLRCVLPTVSRGDRSAAIYRHPRPCRVLPDARLPG